MGGGNAEGLGSIMTKNKLLRLMTKFGGHALKTDSGETFMIIPVTEKEIEIANAMYAKKLRKKLDSANTQQ